MSETTEAVQSCNGCGASIYPEHVTRHTADFLDGKLFCSHCLVDRRASVKATPMANAAPATDPAFGLTDEALAEAAPEKPRIQTSAPIHRTERAFHRALLQGSPNATRCRTFHCRINDASLAYLNEQINEWADSHPDIEIKFATNMIGAMDGKTADQQIIMTLFY